MDTQPFYLWLPVQAPKVINMDLMRCYIVQVVAIFMNIHALLKTPSHKKTLYTPFGFNSEWLLAVLVVAVVLYLHLCVGGVFFGGGGGGDGAVLVSREDKIEILLNGKLFSKSSWIFWFMARLFPLQRSLIHFFWSDVKKSVGQKRIYFGLGHQVIQEFRYRRFRVINRTLYIFQYVFI